MILSLADFCDNTSQGLLTSTFLGKIFFVLKICIPIILIILGTIDMVKAVLNPENKKNYSTIIKRFIYAILIFFVPTFAAFLFNLIDQEETKCLQCFLDPYQKSCEHIKLEHEEFEFKPKPQIEIDDTPITPSEEEKTGDCKVHFDGGFPNNNVDYMDTPLAQNFIDNIFTPGELNDILNVGEYSIFEKNNNGVGYGFNHIVNTFKYSPDAIVIDSGTKIEITYNNEKVLEETGPKIILYNRFRYSGVNTQYVAPDNINSDQRRQIAIQYVNIQAENSFDNYFEMYPDDIDKRINKSIGYENIYFSYEYGFDILHELNNININEDNELIIKISCV